MDAKDISSIRFGIMSPDEIKRMAVCKVDNPAKSGMGSVYDERMGYNPESNNLCTTCGLKKCPGHFGYIELNYPIIHPMFSKLIASFLKCFCKNCHRLLLTIEQIELKGLHKAKGRKRFNAILKECEKVDICIRPVSEKKNCNTSQHKITYKPTENQGTYYEEPRAKSAKKDKRALTVDDIKSLFDQVSDEDVTLLGLDPQFIHPRNLVLTVLPVIPPCSRPPVKQDDKICDDDLTCQLEDIIKKNNLLADPNKAKDWQVNLSHLIFRIQCLMNNSGGKLKHPTAHRAVKGLKERLSGKHGRLRGNLMGKRVNFSARTVIGAEPTLKLNELAIPYEIAAIHTKPENVTKYNIDWLTELVNAGKADGVITTKNDKKVRLKVPYALMIKGTELIQGDNIVRGPCLLQRDEKGKIILPRGNREEKGVTIIPVVTRTEKLEPGDQLVRNGELVEVTFPIHKKISLKIGDIVERQLVKGDIVLFNRQPTLHKGSMLALEVVPKPFKTFRFNLAATKSYGADFDGDEMNIFSPQSYEAESELRYLTSTQNNVISAQESKPIISITQDSLIGFFLMTKKIEFTLTRTQFFDICTKGKRIDGTDLWNPQRVKHIEKILKNHKIPTIYNGYGLFSLLLPQNFNYEKKNNLGTLTIIKEGVLVSGIVDKSIVGPVQGSIIQLLNKEYGVPTVANFIDNAQFISNAWLLVHGFSIGIEDCMVTSERSVATINETLAQCYATTEAIEQQTINPHIREARVIASLDQAVNVGLRMAKEAMKPTNNFLTTVYSGAKGEMFNIAQLTGLLSQQKIEDHRIIPTLTHGKRTLVHYPIGEKISKEREYESRGFIRHSFIHGLTPEEFFFHAMSGRVSCTDTSLSTSRSGYLQRRIIKCCEDIQIQYDRTVRDCSGRIYQFSYGENNLDPFVSIKVEERPFFCDMKRLASQLNTSHELKLSREINAPKLHKLTYSSVTEKMPLKIVTPAPVIQPKVPIILEDEEKEDLESEIDNIQDTDNEDENDENEDEEKEGDEEEEKEEKEEEEEILSDIDSEDFNVEEAFSEYGGEFE